MIVTDEVALAPSAQCSHGVVAEVGGGPVVGAAVFREDQPPLLGDHHEQQTVHQPQQLPVVIGNVEPSGFQCLAKRP